MNAVSQAPAESPAPSKISVLVVDDSDDQRMLLLAYLERAGCEVTTAGSAEEALVAVTTLTPDLVVIDLVMPGMDGWELADHIHLTLPDVPLAITSVLDEDRYPAGHAALPKPFTGAQVRRVLQDAVPRWSAA